MKIDIALRELSQLLVKSGVTKSEDRAIELWKIFKDGDSSVYDKLKYADAKAKKGKIMSIIEIASRHNFTPNEAVTFKDSFEKYEWNINSERYELLEEIFNFLQV